MSNELPERKACPMCKSQGHDSKDDHMFLMDEKPGLCRRYCCSRVEYHSDSQKYYEDVGGPDHEVDPDTLDGILGEGTPVIEQVEKRSELAQKKVHIADLPTVGFRGIPKQQYQKYGAKMELSEADRSVAKVYYPVLTTSGDKLWKIRFTDPKDFKLSEKVGKRKLHFIGQELFDGQRECCIHEGQDDAIAGDLMGNAKTVKANRVLHLSVPNGANEKAFKDNYDFLKKFDKLVFCADNDKPGQELVEKVVGLFPDILIMKMTEKDANKMLNENKAEEFRRAYETAAHYRPPAIVEVSNFLETLKTPVPMGIEYPWKSLDKMTYGMVTPQIVSVGSGPGVGKSSVVRAIQKHLMFHHKLPVGIFSMEDSTEQMLRYLVGYMMNKKIWVPGSTYDTDEAYHYGEMLRDKAFLYDNRYFKGDWNQIESALRFMYSEGVSHFFIDPISALAAHLDSSGGNTFINTIMIKMSRLIQEIPIYLMLVNHLNNPTSGPAHDQGGKVLPSQFTGSKGQWRYSTDMWGFERNSLSEEPEERHIMTVRNLKHRSDGSQMGKTIELKYNVKTGRLEEPSGFVPQVECVGVPDVQQPDPKKHIPVVGETLDDLLGG